MINPALYDDLSAEDSWALAGEVAAQQVWDIANRAADRCNEAVDAMRVHNGMTLDEFLAGQQ